MVNLKQQQKENTLNQDNAVVAIYPTHTAAEAAVQELFSLPKENADKFLTSLPTFTGTYGFSSQKN